MMQTLQSDFKCIGSAAVDGKRSDEYNNCDGKDISMTTSIPQLTKTDDVSAGASMKDKSGSLNLGVVV